LTQIYKNNKFIKIIKIKKNLVSYNFFFLLVKIDQNLSFYFKHHVKTNHNARVNLYIFRILTFEEYRRGFDGGRTITKPTPLCADRVALDDYFRENNDDGE
jgi:hypothetical protein